MASVRGRALRLGDDVNTDVILPARYMQDWATLGEHALAGEGPEFPARVRASVAVVAGKNFGCGSSREQAVMALQQAGIRVVVAKSFARIFYRNAVNLALHLLEGVADVPDGAEIECDLDTGAVVEVATLRRHETRPLPPEARAIVDAGGLLEHVRRKGGGP